MLSVIIKPVSSSCNLACDYCFYCAESAKRTHSNFGKMSLETLENIIKQCFEVAKVSVSFLFQGGEPTLIGKAFFEEAVALQKRYNTHGIAVLNCLQTNGLLIDDAWATFFKKHNFLVGVSLDGIEDVHNFHRRNHLGGGSFEDVMRAITCLKKYNVNFNVLSVVTDESAERIEESYHFFKSHGLYWQQYIACLDDEGKFLDPLTYGQFLCKLYDLWENDLKKGQFIFNRSFENYVGLLLGQMPNSCAMCGVCSKMLAFEANGNAYPCDFYMVDEYCLGNIHKQHIQALLSKIDEMKFVEESQSICDECRACPHYALCRCGCKKEREHGKNKLCEGYKLFFNYATPKMKSLVLSLKHGENEE